MRFFQADSTKVSGMAAGAVSLKKSHDIIILSFCNIVKDKAKYRSNGGDQKRLTCYTYIV